MNILNHKARLIVSFLILAAFALSSDALALELDWPPSPTGIDLNNLTTGRELAEMIAYFYEWGISIGGLAAFFALVMAGFQYLTSVGDPGKMADARDRISSAITGLLLLLASFLILNVINPELTTLRVPKINPPGSTLEPATATIETVLKTCEKALVYPQEEYNGIPEEVSPKNPNENLSSPAKSIEIIGACRLELYDAINCPGVMKPMTVLHASYPDLSVLYLDNPVWCVNIISETTGPPACETDCSMCAGENACRASPAGCWWSTQWWLCLDSSEVTCDIDCSKCTKDTDCWLSMAGCKWEFGYCVPEFLE